MKSGTSPMVEKGRDGGEIWLLWPAVFVAPADVKIMQKKCLLFREFRTSSFRSSQIFLDSCNGSDELSSVSKFLRIALHQSS